MATQKASEIWRGSVCGSIYNENWQKMPLGNQLDDFAGFVPIGTRYDAVMATAGPVIAIRTFSQRMCPLRVFVTGPLRAFMFWRGVQPETTRVPSLLPTVKLSGCMPLQNVYNRCCRMG